MVGCLIIHGFTGGLHEIDPLRKYLLNHTNWVVKAPVLSGHGKELELDEVTYNRWLDETEKELRRLKKQCSKVYVVGFSMGGMIAAYLAANYDVDKLVLLSTARRYLSFKYMSYYIAEMVRDGFKGKLNENELFTHYKSKLGAVPFRANIEFMKLVRETKQYLEDVKSPVFIAHGQRDGVVPYKAAYSLEREISSEHKEVVIFEQSNHMICLGEDRDILNSMILEFLTQTEEEQSNEEE